jgi:glycerol-3-phosphate acyltransferase PlsY
MLGPIVAAAAIGYLLGALPFGYLVARAHGVNIFEHGSGSPGATNVRRVLGARASNLVFALDALKGALAGGWPLYFVWQAYRGSARAEGIALAIGVAQMLGIVGLVFAMLGHSFSCFTRFKGGKGVATGAGGFLVLLPVPTVISAAVWLGAFILSRYVSIASICSALALPAAAWALGQPPWLSLIASAVCAFVIWRHRANIGRLLNGTENRAGRKS